jgi:hypothetical protein
MTLTIANNSSERQHLVLTVNEDTITPPSVLVKFPGANETR